MDKDQDTNANVGYAILLVFIIVFIIFLFLVALFPCGSCGETFKNCNCDEGFSNTKISMRDLILSKKENFQMPNNITEVNYNANYTSPDLNMQGAFLYTQPMGDIKAQMYGGSGQGTSGGFLPLQGHGAATFMKNSNPLNLATPSTDPGMIGGQDNYTGKMFTAEMNGFQNFGSPFALQKGPQIYDENYSNSYLINGGNERVRNPGQSSEGNAVLKCGDWWPEATGSNCTNGNSDLPACEEGIVEKCVRFIKSKMTPEWEKVTESVRQ